MPQFTDLVDVDTLYGHHRDPAWVIVDCRFDLMRPEAGGERYAAGHIPGAVYAHLDRDLSGPVGERDGRHPLPEVRALAARLCAWGVSGDSQVVAYDDAGGAFAARLWWLCRWLGHDAVAVLDGGLPAWTAAGLPLATAEPAPAPAPGTFRAMPRPELKVEADELQQALADDRLLLLDARGAERFRGDAEPIDPVAGHVPGAVNRPHRENLDEDGRFRSPDSLREDYAVLLDGRSPHETAVMCGSGVSACHNILAMHRAGLSDARLYPGSWSEWIRDPRRPTDPPR